jgi:hypothetical protein
MRKLPPFAIPVLLITLAGCSAHLTPAGPEQHETRSVDLDKAESVRVELKMNAGQLNARGGAPRLLDADFTYNVASWKPDVRYRSAGAVGDLTVEQPGPAASGGNSKNRWDLRFADNVPLDMRVKFGAGEAEMNLGTLSLRSIDIEIGVGTLRLDLRGTPKNDYSVRIRGGVGEATVYLPKEAGISATASGGIGGISVSGLHKSGDRYINDALEKAPVRIRVDVHGGVGSIRLVAE